MKKLVILGSSGLLGSNLCLALKKRYKIYSIVNKKKIKISKINSKYINLKKKNEVKKYLKELKPHFLINCVAIPILCLCPPEIFAPLSPIIVSFPCGSSSIKFFN